LPLFLTLPSIMRLALLRPGFPPASVAAMVSLLLMKCSIICPLFSRCSEEDVMMWWISHH
jgi:hypothetical protein